MAIVVNGVLLGFVPALEASLINLLIAVAARHDGIVRGAFALGRTTACTS